jgi:hypothetical protein
MIVSSQFLRRALAADAVASAATGVLLAFGGSLLEGLTGLQSDLTQPAGVFLMGYGAVVAYLASRPALPTAAVWAVIVVNALWAVEGLITLVTGWVEPTPLGYAFVVAQALVVATFAELQFMGLRRSQRLAA